MKRNKSIIKLFLLASLAFGASSCTDRYQEFNKNPYEVDNEEISRDNYRVRSMLVAMEGNVIPFDVNTFQFMDCLLGGSYGGYLADSNNGFKNKFSTYNAKEDWLRSPFNDIIAKTFQNYNFLKQLTDDPVILAVANVVKVASMSRITDVYGPIPYSKVGEDAKLQAPYDSQEEIYNSFFKELDEAITSLMENRKNNFNAFADKVYGGNVESWIKFANSLKLRLALRVAYANPTLAQQKAEEVVKNEIGAFASNADNALAQSPKNPFRIVMYEYNGGDSRVSADITSYMNGFNDPRRPLYFTESTFPGAQNGYIGLRSGIVIPSSETAHNYSNYNVKDATEKLIWMNAAEVAFLKAEGALRGWNMGGTAEQFYKQGISLSFDQWGATGADAYSNDNVSTPAIYKDPVGAFSYNGTASNITIKWQDSDDFERNLERIITQKWIANFPLGHEAWSEFRRTGYPKLMEVVFNGSAGVVDSEKMARRLPFPQAEYNENAANMPQAVEHLNGPDNMATNLWWDCKNK